MGCTSAKSKKWNTTLAIDKLSYQQLLTLSKTSKIDIKLFQNYESYLYEHQLYLISCIQYSIFGTCFTAFYSKIQQFIVIKIYDNTPAMIIQGLELQKEQAKNMKNITKIYDVLYSSKLQTAFLLLELCQGTLETLIAERRKNEMNFSKNEIYSLGIQMITGLINAAETDHEMPSISPENILIDRYFRTIKIVQSYVHFRLLSQSVPSTNHSVVGSRLKLTQSFGDFAVFLKKFQEEIVSLGLILINLTNIKDTFLNLKQTAYPRSKYNPAFAELNEKVIHPLVTFDQISRVEFLNGIRNILKSMLAEERVNQNLSKRLLILEKPIMNLKQNEGLLDCKKFTSFTQFDEFIEKEYLESVEISLEHPLNEKDFDLLKMCTMASENIHQIQIKFKQNNRFGPDQAIKFCSGLSFSESLENLSLSFISSSINSTGIEKLFEQLCQIKNLSKLSLSFKESLVSENSAQKIKESFKNYTKLQSLSLDISNCSLQGNTAQLLAEGVFLNTQISSLTYYLRQLHTMQDASFLKTFGQTLSSTPNLKKLTLSLAGNNIDWKTLEVIVGNLSQNQSISELELDLSQNILGQESLLFLSEKLALCSQLISLALRIQGVGMGSSCLKQFAKNFTAYPKLQRLSLRLQNNNIDDNGARDFLEEISKQTTIAAFLIDLTMNMVVEKDREQENRRILMKMKRLVRFKYLWNF